MEVGLIEAQRSIGYPVAVWIYCYCLCCWSHFAWSVSPMMVYIEYTLHEGVRMTFCFCIYAMVNIKCLSSWIFYSSWWYLNFAYVEVPSHDNPLSWLLGAIFLWHISSSKMCGLILAIGTAFTTFSVQWTHIPWVKFLTWLFYQNVWIYSLKEALLHRVNFRGCNYHFWSRFQWMTKFLST